MALPAAHLGGVGCQQASPPVCLPQSTLYVPVRLPPAANAAPLLRRCNWGLTGAAVAWNGVQCTSLMGIVVFILRHSQKQVRASVPELLSLHLCLCTWGWCGKKFGVVGDESGQQKHQHIGLLGPFHRSTGLGTG